ncbi:PRC-barrel domain-containing protein [Candidatus Falkowbacteria bacterium]|nr:PRC-barrel domain-containing protein [Candidatus Falkowbacteria bacterium]
MLIHAKKLLGLPVYTQSGQHLGAVTDMEIDIDDHTVMNYHVGSSNPIHHLLNNTLIINRRQVISITAEKMVVDDNAPDRRQAFAEAVKTEAEPAVAEGVLTSRD